MKVFLINLPDSEVYAGTKSEAAAVVRDQAKEDRPEITVEEVNVATDKAGVINMLNGEPTITDTLRTFGVTARGSLKEE